MQGVATFGIISHPTFWLRGAITRRIENGTISHSCSPKAPHWKNSSFSAFAEEPSGPHCWLLESEATVVFISYWGIPKWKGFPWWGFPNSHKSACPISKDKNTWLMILWNQAMMLCQHANSLGGLHGEGTLMLVNSGPERESRLFPAPMSCVSKKEAAPALPGGPSLLPVQQSCLAGHLGEAPCPDQQRRGCSVTKLGRAWLWRLLGRTKGEKALFYSFNTVPSRKIRIGGSRLLQIKGTRSFQVKKGGSLSSIRRVGSLKSSKFSRQDSESEAEELQLSQSRDTVTDLGNIEEWVCAGTWGVGRQSPNPHTAQVHFLTGP